MTYDRVIEGRFCSRPNRFIARVEINEKEETVHVKNTGRCRELLIEGCRVWLAETNNPARKTKYDLIAVEKERQGKSPLLINMDSQAPNTVAAEWLPHSGLFSTTAVIRREMRCGNSRFDVYVQDGDRRAFVEVKGVTLEQDGVVRFPDAPTERGVKHLRELTACIKDGYEAYILFVIQMSEATVFSPNDDTHPAFGAVLREAAAAGVHVLAMMCDVTPDSLAIASPVPIQV